MKYICLDSVPAQDEIGCNFVSDSSISGGMESGIVRLRWEVDAAGYQLVEHDKSNGLGRTRESDGPAIEPRGGKPKIYDIGLKKHDVFLELVNTPDTPEGALDFTNKWGLLNNYGLNSLSWFQGQKKLMELSLSTPDEAIKYRLRGWDFGRLEVHLERRGMVFRAANLQQFCWLELFQELTGGADVRRCPSCHTFLPVPKRGRPNKYCSDACKHKMFRKNKRMASERGVARLQ